MTEPASLHSTAASPAGPGQMARRGKRQALAAVLAMAALGAPAAATATTPPAGTEPEVGPGVLFRLAQGEGSTTVTKLAQDGTANGQVAAPGELFPLGSHFGSPGILMTDAERTVLAVVDPVAMAVRSIQLPDDVAALLPAGRFVVVLGEGARARSLIDTANGETINLLDMLAQPDLEIGPGIRVQGKLAVLPGQPALTVIIPVENPTDAFVVPGTPLAVGDDAVLTVSGGEQSTTVQRVGPGTPNRSPVVVPRPLIGRLVGMNAAVSVAIDGTVTEIDFAAGRATRLGTVGPFDRAEVIDDDRILTITDGQATLYDLTGKQLATIDQLGDDPFVVAGADCSMVFTPGAEGRIIEHRRGAASEPFVTTAPPAWFADGGCVAQIVTEQGFALVRDGKLASFAGEVSALSADGDQAVVVSGSGDQRSAVLVDLAAGTETPLGDAAGSAYVYVDG